MFLTRRFLGWLAPALALAVLVGAPASTLAEWGPGKYMLQAVGRMMGSVLEATEKSDFGYDEGICIMAAFLQPKGTIEFVRPVKKGERYLIAGGGDDDVRDLDLEVFDEAGRSIASDTKEDNEPVVVFTATSTGRVTIRQTLFTAERGSFCVASILRRGGYRVPKTNLIASASGIISAANNVDNQVKGKVSFQAGPNQWAMYGGMYRPGQEFIISNVGLGTGRRVVVSAGDTTARDIDLYVMVGGNEVKDEDKDAKPLVDFNANNVSTAKLRIKNVESDGPCLILTTILQIE